MVMGAGPRNSPTRGTKQQAKPAAPDMTRRVLFAALVVVAAATVVFWRIRGGAFTLEPSADQNVVLITIDTLRADALSAYGGPAETPELPPHSGPPTPEQVTALASVAEAHRIELVGPPLA